MNNREKVELQVASLSSSQSQAGAYVLLLTEMDTQRNLPIIIGESEAQAIAMELRGIHPPRPLTHTLFASVLEALSVRLLRIVIYKAEKGIFYTYLYLRSGEMILRVDSRTSDAVALALHMKAPILIYEDILNEESIPQNGDMDKDYSHDATAQNLQDNLLKKKRINNVHLLKEALQKAIDKEDYEQAAVLRDQLNQMTEPNS